MVPAIKIDNFPKVSRVATTTRGDDFSKVGGFQRGDGGDQSGGRLTKRVTLGLGQGPFWMIGSNGGDSMSDCEEWWPVQKTHPYPWASVLSREVER